MARSMARSREHSQLSLEPLAGTDTTSPGLEGTMSCARHGVQIKPSYKNFRSYTTEAIVSAAVNVVQMTSADVFFFFPVVQYYDQVLDLAIGLDSSL